jgi:hypothetical protein
MAVAVKSYSLSPEAPVGAAEAAGGADAGALAAAVASVVEAADALGAVEAEPALAFPVVTFGEAPVDTSLAGGMLGLWQAPSASITSARRTFITRATCVPMNAPSTPRLTKVIEASGRGEGRIGILQIICEMHRGESRFATATGSVGPICIIGETETTGWGAR